MKIQIWFDYVCPFCYIGKKQLELAIEALGMKDDVNLEMKSFELDPNAPRSSNGTIEELLAGKYGMSLEQAKAGNVNVARMAEAVGLHINFKDMKYTNTFDAHRLTQFAKEKKLEKEFQDALLHAYFVDSRLISDSATLIEVGVSVGLDKDELIKVLESNAYGNDVRRDEALARDKGISGVPYFVINDQFEASGAQSVEGFQKILLETGLK